MYEEYTPEMMRDPNKYRAQWRGRIITGIVILILILSIYIFGGNNYGGRIDPALLEDGYALSVTGDHGGWRVEDPESAEEILDLCLGLQGASGSSRPSSLYGIGYGAQYYINIATDDVGYSIGLPYRLGFTIGNDKMPGIIVITNFLTDNNELNEQLLAKMGGVQYWLSTMPVEDYNKLLSLVEACTPEDYISE